MFFKGLKWVEVHKVFCVYFQLKTGWKLGLGDLKRRIITFLPLEMVKSQQETMCHLSKQATIVSYIKKSGLMLVKIKVINT
jgi:hypothetical protein